MVVVARVKSSALHSNDSILDCKRDLQFSSGMGRAEEKKCLITLWSVAVSVQTGGLQLSSAHLCKPRITLSHVMNVGCLQKLLRQPLIQKQTLQTNQQTNTEASHMCLRFVSASLRIIHGTVDFKSAQMTEPVDRLIDTYNSIVYVISHTAHPSIPL